MFSLCGNNKFKYILRFSFLWSIGNVIPISALGVVTSGCRALRIRSAVPHVEPLIGVSQKKEPQRTSQKVEQTVR